MLGAATYGRRSGCELWAGLSDDLRELPDPQIVRDAPLSTVIRSLGRCSGPTRPQDGCHKLSRKPGRRDEAGWRKGEVATLEWSAVDKDGTRVTLRRERSKNGEPRVLPLVGELGEIIARRREARAYTMRTGRPALAVHVFHRNGVPVRDFRGSWEAACIAAGFARPKVDASGRPVLDRKGRPVMTPTLIFHDLRRSAVRNLVAAGVDQAVAMRVTGHQTISVFQRYRIVSDDAVRAALGKVQGHNSGHNTTSEGVQRAGGVA